MTTPEERERTRRELHELAELAKPASADSSGYVDLSAFSSSDPNWVEHALAKSRGEEPHRAAPIESKSIMPVSLSSLLAADAPPPRTNRRRTLAIAGMASVLALGVGAVVLARRPPPASDASPVVAVAPPVVAPQPEIPPVTPEAPTVSPAGATEPLPPATAGRASSPSPKKKRLAPPPTRTWARGRASPRPATPPSTAGGGDLMKAMQQSFGGAAPPH
jgi:hypothetical protein